MKKVYLGVTAEIIHPGIINIIQEGSARGELTIGLLTDAALAQHKPLPLLTFEQRKKILENIKGVHRVIAQSQWDYAPTLQELRPDIMIHGDDWLSNELKPQRARCLELLKTWGGELIEIPYTKGVSSTLMRELIRHTGISANDRLRSFNRVLEAKKFVRALEAHNGLSALVVDNAQSTTGENREFFDALWLSSLTDSVAKGKPDNEVVDLTSRLQTVHQVLESTQKPIIYDADTGGQPEHFVHTVRTLERLGVSVLIVEDKTGLKHNSLFGTEVTQEQESIESFCYKIERGLSARQSSDLNIVARIESLISGKDLADAQTRASAYMQAGASGVMIHAKDKDPERIFAFCEWYRKRYTQPLIVVPTTYDQVKEEDLRARGANVIIYANYLLRASYPAMKKAAELILEHRRGKEASATCMSVREILELVPGM